jgi:hypothetical protein
MQQLVVSGTVALAQAKLLASQLHVLAVLPGSDSGWCQLENSRATAEIEAHSPECCGTFA